MDSLIDRFVTVTVSDPWEFAAPNGSNVFDARILRVRPRRNDNARIALLLEFGEPVRVHGRTWRHFIAEERVQQDLAVLAAGSQIDCNLFGIRTGKSVLSISLDSSDWRGGLAAVAQIQLSSSGQSHGPA